MTEAEFIAAVAHGHVEPFGHREHLRLAHALLTTLPPEHAEARAEQILRSLAEHAGHPEKYHVTLTLAWMRAVAHHMDDGPAGQSFDQLLDRHPQLLRPTLLDHHYSANVLFGSAARSAYVAPDRVPIPA